MSKYLVFRTDTNTYMGSSAEAHPIYKATKENFDTVEDASRFILNECLDGKGPENDYRIFEEFSVIPVWESRIEQEYSQVGKSRKI